MTALAERFRRCGHLHYQSTFAIPDRSEVVVLVKGLRFAVDGIHHNGSTCLARCRTICGGRGSRTHRQPPVGADLDNGEVRRCGATLPYRPDID